MIECDCLTERTEDGEERRARERERRSVSEDGRDLVRATENGVRTGLRSAEADRDERKENERSSETRPCARTAGRAIFLFFFGHVGLPIGDAKGLHLRSGEITVLLRADLKRGKQVLSDSAGVRRPFAADRGTFQKLARRLSSGTTAQVDHNRQIGMNGDTVQLGYDSYACKRSRDSKLREEKRRDEGARQLQRKTAVAPQIGTEDHRLMPAGRPTRPSRACTAPRRGCTHRRKAVGGFGSSQQPDPGQTAGLSAARPQATRLRGSSRSRTEAQCLPCARPRTTPSMRARGAATAS